MFSDFLVTYYRSLVRCLFLFISIEFSSTCFINKFISYVLFLIITSNLFFILFIIIYNFHWLHILRYFATIKNIIFRIVRNNKIQV